MRHLIVLACACASAAAVAQAAPRPLSDFLETQGTYCLDFDGIPGCDLVFPPGPNILRWTGPAPAYTFIASVDYAGVQNRYLVTQGEMSLGTTVAGQVNERSLSNGRAEVQVTLQTKNALTYVHEFTGTIDAPLLYGHPLADILTGATPALSNCSFQLTFTNPAPGAPLPDFLQLVAAPTDDQFLQTVAISCSGKGALVSGGMASFIMRQTGTLLRTPGRGANADGAPVELIALHPIGGESAFEFREAPGQ